MFSDLIHSLLDSINQHVIPISIHSHIKSYHKNQISTIPRLSPNPNLIPNPPINITVPKISRTYNTPFLPQKHNQIIPYPIHITTTTNSLTLCIRYYGIYLLLELRCYTGSFAFVDVLLRVLGAVYVADVVGPGWVYF